MQRNTTQYKIDQNNNPTKIYKFKLILIKFLNVINLANMLIGGGVMTMPASIASGGLFLGLCLCVLMAIVSSYTSVLLLICMEKVRINSYQEMSKAALGISGYYITLISQFFYSFFVSVAFCILITDNLIIIAGYYFPGTIFATNRPLILLLNMVLIITPLSLFKKLTHLEKFSLISIAMIVFIMIFMVIRTPTIIPQVFINDDSYRLGYVYFVNTLAKMSFAYTIHHNLFGAYKTTPNEVKNDFIPMLYLAYSIVTLVNVVVFTVCFVTFNLFLKGNVFNYFCSNDNLANLSRLMFTITISLTFPFQIFAARETLMNFSKFKLQQYRFSHYIVTLILIVIIYLIGAFYQNIDIVVQITGSLTSIPLVFVLPPLIYMKLVLKTFKPNSINAVLSWFIVIFGACVLVCSTGLIIYEFIIDASCIPNKFWCDMFYV